jgi:hypothetical protein
MKEATPEEECALRACKSVEAAAAEVDARVMQDSEAVTSVEYSPDPDVRLIRKIWARKKGCWNECEVCEVHVGAVCVQRVAAPAFWQAWLSIVLLLQCSLRLW